MASSFHVEVRCSQGQELKAGGDGLGVTSVGLRGLGRSPCRTHLSQPASAQIPTPIFQAAPETCVDLSCLACSTLTPSH